MSNQKKETEEQKEKSFPGLEGLEEFNITEDQFKEFKDAFDLFDIDGSGTIDKKELRAVMKASGQELSDKEIDKLMLKADADQSGAISFTEFVKLMMTYTT